MACAGAVSGAGQHWLSIPIGDFAPKAGAVVESSARYYFANRHLGAGLLGATYYQGLDKPRGIDKAHFSVNALMALVEAYVPLGKVKPYLGINLGAANSSFVYDKTTNGTTNSFSTYYISFAFAPVVGVKVPISNSLDFDANMRYFNCYNKLALEIARGNTIYIKREVQILSFALGLACNFGR